MSSLYAVAKGKTVGIYSSWSECEKQVRGFKGAVYKKFSTRNEAEDFIREKNSKATTSVASEENRTAAVVSIINLQTLAALS